MHMRFERWTWSSSSRRDRVEGPGRDRVAGSGIRPVVARAAQGLTTGRIGRHVKYCDRILDDVDKSNSAGRPLVLKACV